MWALGAGKSAFFRQISQPGPRLSRPASRQGAKTPPLAPYARHSGIEFSPRRRLVVLQEFAPEMLAGEVPGEYRIHDPRRTVDDVERRREAELGLARRVDGGVLVGDPS